MSGSPNVFHLSLEFWTLTVTSPISEFTSIFLFVVLTLVRKIFSDKDESQIRSSVLSLPFDKIIPSPRSKSTLPWSACCENNDKSSFVIFSIALVSSGCASHGILHTLVTFASDFACEPLPRIVTKTPNVFSHIPAASLSLSWIAHSVPVLPLSPESDFKILFQKCEGELRGFPAY